MSYVIRINHPSLDTLKNRRLRADLVTVYKLSSEVLVLIAMLLSYSYSPMHPCEAMVLTSLCIDLLITIWPKFFNFICQFTEGSYLLRLKLQATCMFLRKNAFGNLYVNIYFLSRYFVFISWYSYLWWFFCFFDNPYINIILSSYIFSFLCVVNLELKW